MLRPTHISETALYVDDLNRAVRFYVELFGSTLLRRDDRFCALDIANEQVLLLFQRGGSVQPALLSGGTVPAHDGSGPLHVCFGIASGEAPAWEKKLHDLDIPIESKVQWPEGAISLYFRDPDGHAVELATPGLWK